MIQSNKTKEVFLTQAQYTARETAGTLEQGVIYHITDAKVAKTDLASGVQTSLDKADAAEVASNKKTTLTSSTTDYPCTSAVKSVTDALDTRITNISSLGRFLSIWNCNTGLPYTDPTSLPYEYKTGDYYIIGTLGRDKKMIVVKDEEGETIGTYTFVGMEEDSYTYTYVCAFAKYTSSTEFSVVYVLKTEVSLVAVGDTVYADPDGMETLGTVTSIYNNSDLMMSPVSTSYTGVPGDDPMDPAPKINDLLRFDGSQWSHLSLETDPTLLKNTATGDNSLTINGSATAGGDSVNIGSSSSCAAADGVAIGVWSRAGAADATAVGYGATANAANSIQLGSGTNANANTFQVGSYQVLDANGKIPFDRLSVGATSLDSPLVVGKEYVLSSISSLAMTLPSTGAYSGTIHIIFTASAAFTPTISGTYGGETPYATISGKTYEYLFAWNGTKWILSTLYY